VNEWERVLDLGSSYQMEGLEGEEWKALGQEWAEFRWSYHSLPAFNITGSSDQKRHSLKMPLCVKLWVACLAFQSFDFFLISICLLKGDSKASVTVLQRGFEIFLLMHIGMVIVAEDPVHMYSFVLLSSEWCIWVLISRFQQHWLRMVALVSALTMFNHVVLDSVYVGEASHVSYCFATSTFNFVMWATFSIAYWKCVQRSRTLVKDDEQRYKAVWSGILSNHGRDLSKLDATVKDLQKRINSPPRQLHRCNIVDGPSSSQANPFQTFLCAFAGTREKPSGEGSSEVLRNKSEREIEGYHPRTYSSFHKLKSHLYWMSTEFKLTSLGSPGKVDPGLPVQNLDQLYSQAMLLCPVLHRRASNWALMSNGNVPLGKLADSTWTSLKSPSRAIQKAVRTYWSDPSYVLDICRCSIVFPTVSELTTCLECIYEDEQVELVRLRSRMTNDDLAHRSAGYRDVCVNLRIINQDTVAVGCENHVMEVQLLLQPIAAIKHDKAHLRYVHYRNLRCE